MSESSLQFERAEFAQPVAARVVCASCNREVVQSYYEIAGNILCSSCREQREHAFDGLGLGRFLRALVAGLVVGAAGAAVWYGVRALTNYEIGIIAIAIGYGVGKAVHWGSRGKGGWLYQLLAVFLTYTAIVATYVPYVVKGAVEGGAQPTPLIYAVSFVLSYAVPFLMGFENIIGLLIIAFGLWEAWKFNKRVDAAITGPYTVTPAAPVPAANV